MTEVEPVELAEPVDVVAWLRALPVGTVLLDGGSHSPPHAWQVRSWCEWTGAVTAPREFIALVMVGSSEAFELGDDDDAAAVADEGPFRVLWTPGGAT